MGRCNSCFAVVKKYEKRCYVCGEKVPHHASLAQNRKKISLASNLLFMASLAFSFYCFFAQERLSLAVSLAISGGLLLLRLLADRHTRQFESRGSTTRKARAAQRLASRIILTSEMR
jgi:hypothetical protein